LPRLLPGWNFYLKKFWARYCLSKHWLNGSEDADKETYAITATNYETDLETPREIEKEQVIMKFHRLIKMFTSHNQCSLFFFQNRISKCGKT